MKRKLCQAIFAALLTVLSQPSLSENLSYFFGKDMQFDPSIPTPESVLGYQVGEKHVSHPELVNYLKTLATISDRFFFEVYGYTYEKKPLILLAVSDPENIWNLDRIKEDRKKIFDLNESATPYNAPLIVWMGYSIHGNEASASNSTLLTAYYLAAAQDARTMEMLKETVVLIDPCLNPDGFDRYAQWANSQQSKNLIEDSWDLEHYEYYPGGRTNHYWFDMNRDWLPLVHPESESRMKKFHEWKPNVLTDHHEMQTNNSFFFQPGIPSRNHPLTPRIAHELTVKLTNRHAKAFDQLGHLYFTKESFDDFYYGKGSTYPDINGGIGILFEQASSRGKVQESQHGLLTFEFTIKNQLTASLATLESAYEMKSELINHQRNTYREALEQARNENFEAYLVTEKSGSSKLDHFIRILVSHQIKVYKLLKEVHVEEQVYQTDKSILIPISQPQYRTIMAMFETRTQFEDSLFYDISTWNFPHAFNLSFDAVSRISKLVGPEITEVPKRQGNVIGGKSNYAYIFRWDDYFASSVLNQLMGKDLQVKVASMSFTTHDGQTFGSGSIIIPLVSNLSKYNSDEIYDMICSVVQSYPVDFYSLSTGYSLSGTDLGSSSNLPLNKPKIIMPVGPGISAGEAGEVWHLLDQRMDIKLTRIPVEQFGSVDLNRYNTLILVHGGYGSLNGSIPKIKSWIQNGGNVIAIKGAVKWLADNNITNVKFKETKPDTTFQQLPYDEMRQARDAKLIRGAIFNAKLDLTHPVAYGLGSQNIPVFKENGLFMIPSKNPYANPAIHDDDPLLSGYVTPENLDKLKNSAVVTVSALGQGRIISFSINPNFRAFWWGTNQLFLNSLFFGQTIDLSSAR